MPEHYRGLDELIDRVQERFDAAVRTVEPLLLLSDPPFVTRGPLMFTLRCFLAGVVLAVAAVVMLFVWEPAGLVLGAAALLAFVARLIVKWFVVAPARRRLRACRVRPAVVVQAFNGGFEPPDGERNVRPFTGIWVFSFDPAVAAAQLQELAQQCFAHKRDPDGGPFDELKRLLLTGDTEFVHRTYRLPREMAGNDRTFATPCLWVRERDLADGYLSTHVQLILAHPEHPQHICAVPHSLWKGGNAREVLDDRRDD